MANKIEIFRGTTYPVVYNHVDSTGAAVALTGKTLYFTVKQPVYDSNATDTSAVIKKTVLPVDHTDAAGGISGFTLDDADTYIDPGKYHYDFIIETADGLAEPPSVYGEFVVKGHPSNRQVGNE